MNTRTECVCMYVYNVYVFLCDCIVYHPFFLLMLRAFSVVVDISLYSIFQPTNEILSGYFAGDQKRILQWSTAAATAIKRIA